MKTKRNKLVRLILPLFILFSLLLTGCEQYNLFGKNDNSASGDENKDSNSEKDNNTTEDEKESSGLEGGFGSDNSCETLSGACAFKSDKTEFDIDDVTLEFFYGDLYPSGIEHELENGRNYPWFDVVFINDEYERVVIKRVEENFVSEKYRYYKFYDENNKVIDVKYNFSEVLTIPKELFTKKMGFIWFSIYSDNSRDPRPEYQLIADITIYYKVVGDKVILSNKPFK